jgi:hypothetical protein
LGELNAAIRELTDELNTRTMRRIGCSRRALFEAIERTALLALPSEPSNTPSGSAVGLASTTTSRCAAIGIPCRIA